MQERVTNNRVNDPGIKGISAIFPIRRVVNSWWFRSCMIGSALVCGLAFYADQVLELLQLATESTISIVPGILGVVLAAYALVVAFMADSSAKILQKKVPKKDYTLIQAINASFVQAVFILTGVLLLGFAVQVVSKIAAKFPVPNLIAVAVNLGALFLILSGLCYSILLCAITAKNVFGAGQMLRVEEEHDSTRPPS